MITTRIWEKQPGAYFCIFAKGPNGERKTSFFRRSEFGKVQAYVDSIHDHDVYACPHGLTRKVRQKEYAVAPKCLYADLDEVNPSKLGDLKPTIAFRSSPGRYVGIWITDVPVTEELNKRLTYYIGADHSGWDRTQLLRIVPGTVNYKYENFSFVMLLWDDGPTYRVRDLERRLPKLDEVSEATGEVARKLYSREVAERIAKDCAVYAMWSQRVTAKSKRSDVIWRLGVEALENGYSVAKAVAVAMHSAAFEMKHGGTDTRSARQEIERLFDKFPSKRAELEARGKIKKRS